MNPCGLIVPGRPVLLTPSAVFPPNKAVYDVVHAELVKNIAVFLTGAVPLAEGTAAAIYVSWPPYNASRFIGFVSTAKASSLFRINAESAGYSPQSCGPDGVTAKIGMEFVSMDQIEALTIQLQQNTGVSLSTQNLRSVHAKDLPEKLVDNFYTYATSFASASPTIFPKSSSISVCPYVSVLPSI